jgi:hypothetical protein
MAVKIQPEGCLKCNGIRQWPAGCVIGLDDIDCPMRPVDVIGTKDFVGHAGPVKVDIEGAKAAHARADDYLASIGRDLDGQRLSAEVLERRRKGLPDYEKPPLGKLSGRFAVAIEACDLKRIQRIPAAALAQLYRDAVISEMSESVKAATSVEAYAISDPLPGDRTALITVEVLGATMVSNAGMSYMFQLRDAVMAAINNFVPPEDAWVDDEPENTHQGVERMNTIAEIEKVIEEVTSTTDPVASVGVFVDWITKALNRVSVSVNPAHAAVDLASVLEMHKEPIAAAVAANTAQPGTPEAQARIG